MKTTQKYFNFKHDSTLLQIRLVSILTGIMYIIYSQIGKQILSVESSILANSIHLYIIAPLLFFVALLTLNKRFYNHSIYLLMFSTIVAASGNLILVMNIEDYTIYLTEEYLIIFWVFTISGLPLLNSIITVVIILLIKIIWIQYFFTLPHNLLVMDFFWLFSVISFGLLIAFLLERSNRIIFLNNESLKELSMTDALTGLYNRRKLNESISFELTRCKEFKHSLGLMVLDIDFFKKVNDEFGHQLGDNLLIEISNIIKKSVRSTDLVVRWGGEEFMVACLETSKEDTLSIAEDIRVRIENSFFEEIGKKTISIGVSEYKSDDTIYSLIRRADEALYLAKENGRNKIEFL